MEREFSAGGVLLRQIARVPHVAAIRPQGKKPGVWALPKGNLEPGEAPADTAVREVLEETGVHGTVVEKLGDVRYFYQRSGKRIFKRVTFYLLAYREGSLEDHDDEVEEARWIALQDAQSELSHTAEREMVARAVAYLEAERKDR